jgi:hypothetical protein
MRYSDWERWAYPKAIPGTISQMRAQLAKFKDRYEKTSIRINKSNISQSMERELILILGRLKIEIEQLEIWIEYGS